MKASKKILLSALACAAACLVQAPVFGSNPLPRKITPLLDADRMVTLDGTWRFELLPGRPIVPERFEEDAVVLDGQPGAADTIFYRRGFDTASWQEITVPGCWEMQGFCEPTYGVVPSYAGLYKREFTLPSDWEGGHVFVRFGGVLYSYTVWVDGARVGGFDSAYNAASFEITPYLLPGRTHEIAVRVDTRSRYYMLDKADNWALSGIFRSVDLMWFPPTYIDDCYIVTSLSGRKGGKVTAHLTLDGETPAGHRLSARLYSPKGKLLARSEQAVRGPKADLTFSVANAALWTAETPSLYTLEVALKQDGKTLQTLTRKVGIREITIRDGVLLLNGTPIKVHGVNSHDLDPYTAKTLSLESMERDVRMWKEGNINFLRCSHYPPDERKLALCDSAGIYVACEVPFNFWRDRDTALVENLVTRGEATVLRDRSHPSVIMWNIGNEEPIRENTVQVARKVRSLDPTRLITFPGSEPESTLPPEADVFSYHYPSLSYVQDFQNSGRPFIATEYAHALGLAFGNDFAQIWKEMFNKPWIAGGAVWHFQDQGILRRSATGVDRNALTPDVWTGPTQYLAAFVEGCDGIVYADRTPQADWYLVRDTYSPVQIVENRLSPAPGAQLAVHVVNQYDFLDLSTLTGQWTLLCNREEVSRGTLSFSCAPHDTVLALLPVRSPEDPGRDVWTLRTAFQDQSGREIYEHDICLTSEESVQAIKQEIRSCLSDGDHTLDPAALVPLCRAGRPVTITDETVKGSRNFRDKEYYWDPYLLNPSDIRVREAEDGYAVRSTYWRPNWSNVTEHLLADYKFQPLGSGAYDLQFDITPVTPTGYLLEAGVSWKLPEDAMLFQWLGDGPFSYYPDRRGNEQYGIHRSLKGDLYFNGNRTRVQIALVTDAKGNGMAILSDGADIAVEVVGGQVILSYNSFVAGVGYKQHISQVNYPASEVASFGGALTVIPLKEGAWPEALERIFGYPDPAQQPFYPFWHSYDRTR